MCWLSDGWIRKVAWQPKNYVSFGTLIKNVCAVGFSGKPDFLERVCFHCAMLCVTNFGIVIGACIVLLMIFINKYVL